jgi:hypothetical protein
MSLKNSSNLPGTGEAKTAGNISISQLAPEQARANLRMLLLANPNYFGNLPQSGLKPVLNIAGDTTYEELGCVGFSPSLSRLEAVDLHQTDLWVRWRRVLGRVTRVRSVLLVVQWRRNMAGPRRGELSRPTTSPGRSRSSTACSFAGHLARGYLLHREPAPGPRHTLLELHTSSQHTGLLPDLGKRCERHNSEPCV